MTDAPESTPGRRSRTGKRRFLWKLRQKWKLLGLFEIDREHEFYGLTCMLKVGLRTAIQEAIDNPPADALSDADCKVVQKQAHEGFEMRTYGGPAFAHLRHFLGLSEKEYQLSLSSQSSYLQFISNSKSKADFFLTNNKSFFLKTQSKREIRFLLSNLPKYIQHLERYPHSLLVRFLGVHSITVAQQKKKYFIIMQSVFYPDDRILKRYDIKGCQVNRWTEPAPEGSQVIVVLKDLNFEGNVIHLGQQRPWLLRQMELDTQFLQELNVLDYSLLVAFQPLHADERGQNLSFADIIFRTTKSLTNPESSLPTSVSGIVDEESDVVVSEMVGEADLYQLHELYSGVQDLSLQSIAKSDPELAHVLAQNRRLLPRSKSPLHLLDGPELRYFMGIIDLFTVYSFRKRLEHLWKCIRYRGQTFSTVSPSDYARRLCQWVEAHTM
ncbi:phosphatidylinositol 4-phosphate 5-kinase-like protein 1 [Emydura macquarii macquarii]|uniref:phosphatidylinositol 4-phosphate 5-kinase-like protein 1 n=1 Tax=Emydura macquarii macquarii TaxID=1129001 RepID=UPI00352A3F64